jgi:hypothetical protein
MRGHRAAARCPWCHNHIPSSILLFSGVRCPHCRGRMYVSVAYGRALGLLSLLIAFCLVWLAGIRDLYRLGMIGCSMSFLALVVVLRTAPLLIPPKLVGRRQGGVTTLGLAQDDDAPLVRTRAD